MHDNHPGITSTKVIQQRRETFYFLGLAAKITRHVSQFMQSMQTKKNRQPTTHPAEDFSAQTRIGPEDAPQTDIVPFDEPSNGYTAIVTARYVISRYLFTYCVTRRDARTIAKALVDIMTATRT